ncbi:hypothetical protein C1A34_07920 [Lactobacillus amylovorus]|nr:hypothetical protein C1A34_07920 [Lactobacillus amylovorus]
MNGEIFEILVNGLGDKDSRKSKLTLLIRKSLSRNIDPEQVGALASIANNNTSNPLSLKEITKIMNFEMQKEIERRKRIEEINNKLHEIGLDANQLK